MRHSKLLQGNDLGFLYGGWRTMRHAFCRWAFAFVLSAAALLPAALLPTAAWAQRSMGPDLLPASTVAMFQIPDFQLLTQRFRETALGKIGQDPEMKPLLGKIYGASQQAFSKNGDKLGLTLDELLSIPQGELCFGFAVSPEQEPGFILILDAKDKAESFRKLIPSLEFVTRKIGENPTFGWERLHVEERDGLFIMSPLKKLLEQAIANLDGKGLEKTLAETDKYSAIINRCLAGGDQPHVVLYADPIEFIRNIAGDSPIAIGLALFPALGIDGLRAVGGTMTFASGDFDSVQHMHLLLDHPRLGVVDAIGLSSGDMTPESWVPGDAASYSTIHWDLRHTFTAASRLFNGIMGDGEWERRIRTDVSGQLGADFETEILPQLSGRGTQVQWVERPVRVNSMSMLMGLQLKDPQAFKPVLQKIVSRHSAALEKQQYGTDEYWTLKGDSLGFFPWQWQEVKNQRALKKRGVEIRDRVFCLGIVNDYLLLTDSLKAYQEAVRAKTNRDASLSDSLDFKLIASKVKRQPKGDAPGMMSFQRPEEGLRMMYDLVNAENSRKMLAAGANRNAFFSSVQQALNDHPLPRFEKLAEYVAPGGGMMVSDESGIHYTAFGLKRQ